jgi:hypothetical protein
MATKGVVWCAHIKSNDSNGKVAAGSSDNQPVAMSIESKKELKRALRMHISRAHAFFGTCKRGCNSKDGSGAQHADHSQWTQDL